MLGQYREFLEEGVINLNVGDAEDHKLSESEAIFFFIHEKKTLPPTSALVSQIYHEHQKDGFLKLDIALENTFG